MTLAFFEDTCLRQMTYHLPERIIHRLAFPFPDNKVTVLGPSLDDDFEGQIVIHNRALQDQTKGKTSHFKVAHIYRAERMFLAMGIKNIDERRLLQLRMDELRLCAEYLLRAGRITREAQYKDIFELLTRIEQDLGWPKRNPHKRRAAEDVSTARQYRSPRGLQPVGPVASFSTRGAIAQIESRICDLLGIKSYAHFHHVILQRHMKDAEAIFKAVKEVESIEQLKPHIDVLRKLKVHPYLHPARRIMDAYEAHTSDASVVSIARHEANAVLLVGFVERRVIRRMSDIYHRRVSGALLIEAIDKTLALISAIERRINEARLFSDETRAKVVGRFVRARSVLAQQELFASDQHRMRSAQRILDDLVYEVT